LGPIVTLAENVPLVQLLELCEYTTGNDWLDSSSSWHEVACETVPVTVTVPPDAGTDDGEALAEATMALGAGATLM
jgi:hypothetical protein